MNKAVFLLLPFALLMTVATMGEAQNADPSLIRVFELPQFISQPTLDGVKGDGEWDNALELPCSPSSINEEGAEFGWADQENGISLVSGNQLNQSEGEEASVARTDADSWSNSWHAWDDEAWWYIAHVGDNVRDVTGPSPEGWWSRDSTCLYLDLTNSKAPYGPNGEHTTMNIINYVAAPMKASAVNVTWEYLVEGLRTSTNDPDLIDGFEYGFRDAGDEFGGEEDYAIEGKVSWETLMRFDLPAIPEVGSEMGLHWLILDPDNDDGYGGQLVCYGAPGGDQSFYTTIVFSDTPAGGAGTAVAKDSWGRIKESFSQ